MDLDRYYELRTILLRWKTLLAENLRRKIEATPQAQQRLRNLFDQEGASDAFSDWLSLWCRQAAIQWILRLLFLRVLEDRNLLGATRIRNGDGQHMWGQLARNLGAASYLLWCCRDAAHLLPDLFGPTEFDFLLPDDDLVQRFFDDVWRRPDSNRENWLRFDFRPDPSMADEGFQTRFIGDLYQELDSEIRERHALLQTPDFIAEFILENTLLKRFEEKDFRTVTMIDPTCGSGHFLVDGFWLFVQYYEKASGRSRERLTVQERSRIARCIAEEHIFGCDINPYASALSRFRLILAVCDYARPASLQDLRDLHLNIVTIDSLIPYEKIVNQGVWGGEQTARILGHPDDIQRALPVLKRRYDVVVGNPPYISVTNNSKSKIYRQYYLSASGKFGLSAPFTERFIQLCADDGAIGLINSNAFSKRQFGASLINSVLPQYNLWSVIDLGGAYIPGHGTPTLILFLQKQPPNSEFVKVVSNIKGEPGIPTDPANGLVWRDILNNIHKENYLGEYIAIGPLSRQEISKYPWNFKAIERRIMVLMQSHSDKTIAEISSLLGTSVITGADDIFVIESDFSRRLKLSPSYLKSYAFGSDVRDWAVIPSYMLILPYDEENLEPLDISSLPELLHYLLPFQELLSSRTSLSGEAQWFELCRMKYTAHEDKRAIFAVLIASHNHFSYNTKGTLPQQGVPAIKLSEESSNDYLATTAILNTGVVNFFLKQICFNFSFR